MSEIKPCPFCGGAAVTYLVEDGYYTGCSSANTCEVRPGVTAYTWEECRVAWNGRPIEDDLTVSRDRASDACASVQKERDELREMLGGLRDVTMVEVGSGGGWSLEFDFGDGDENRDQMRQFADNLRAFLARYEGGR